MDKKISIIVPVYNNRKYLQECVDSIENQEYRNIECLLVDDGSDTDFVGYYDTFKSDRTTVYHINKSGVSGARNYGLAKATGDYVCFVDSDDIISPRYCSKLIDMIGNSGKRVATCAYARFRTSPLNKLSGGGYKSLIINDLDKWLNILYDSPFSAEGFLWNKLFEKDVLEGLIFDTNLSMNEDQLFAFEAIKRVDGLVVTNEPLYFYRTSNVSATANMTAEKYKQALYVANKLLDIVGNEVEEVVVGYKNYFASICYNYCGYLAKKWPSGWSHEIKIYRQKYIQNYAPSLLRNKDKKWKQMFVKSFSLWVFAMISYSLARNILKLIKR